MANEARMGLLQTSNIANTDIHVAGRGLPKAMDALIMHVQGRNFQGSAIM